MSPLFFSTNAHPTGNLIENKHSDATEKLSGIKIEQRSEYWTC